MALPNQMLLTVVTIQFAFVLSVMTPGVTYEKLTAFAEQLRGEGIEAKADLFRGRDGLMVDRVFFPLDELNDPANSALLAARDFAAIVDRRNSAKQP
jgi:hypothetical protein